MIGNRTQINNYLINQNEADLFEIKKVGKKRSLTQNSYCWVLITELGNALRKSKEEIYFEMLKDYGQSITISIDSNINPKGYFQYYEEIGQGMVKGKLFKHYKVYLGSSNYNSKEMTILIDGIIQECKQQGIETLTPEQIARMELN